MSDQEGSGFSIQFWVDLAHRCVGALESYKQFLTEISQSLKNYDQMILRPVTGSATLDATGFAIIDLGEPGTGFEWLVRHVVFSDALKWSNTMGSATVQFGVGAQSVVPDTPMQGPTVRWPFTVVPNAATFGKNEFPVGSGERLYCQILGGTASQVIQATATVEQWPVKTQPKRTG